MKCDKPAPSLSCIIWPLNAHKEFNITFYSHYYLHVIKQNNVDDISDKPKV